jgi:class 3 adenylate cyclase
MTMSAGAFHFLFTDIEGSTSLWEADPERMSRNLALHDQAIREAIFTNLGSIFAITGDGFGAVFPSADGAVQAALAIQLALEELEVRPVLRVRVGIHSGCAEQRDGSYYGPTVNQAARLADLGRGGHIVASSQTIDALTVAFDAVSTGSRWLRGMQAPVLTHEVTGPCAERSTMTAPASLALV